MKYLIFVLCFYSINVFSQSFELAITNDTTSCNYSNDVCHCYSTIINNNSVPLEIDIIRQTHFSDENWLSGMCADTICYVTSIDSIRISINANSNIEFRSGFILRNDTTSQIAKSTYLIQDINDFASHFSMNTYAVNASITSSIKNIQIDNQLDIYPNPTSDIVYLRTELAIESVEILNSNGQFLNKIFNQKNLDLSPYNCGIIMLKIKTASGYICKRVLRH